MNIIPQMVTLKEELKKILPLRNSLMTGHALYAEPASMNLKLLIS